MTNLPLVNFSIFHIHLPWLTRVFVSEMSRLLIELDKLGFEPHRLGRLKVQLKGYSNFYLHCIEMSTEIYCE